METQEPRRTLAVRATLGAASSGSSEAPDELPLLQHNAAEVTLSQPLLQTPLILAHKLS